MYPIRYPNTIVRGLFQISTQVCIRIQHGGILLSGRMQLQMAAPSIQVSCVKHRRGPMHNTAAKNHAEESLRTEDSLHSEPCPIFSLYLIDLHLIALVVIVALLLASGAPRCLTHRFRRQPSKFGRDFVV